MRSMTKRIKKREDEEEVKVEKSKIEQFCESFEKVNTQVSYKTVLKKIEGLETLKQEDLWDSIEAKDIETDKKRRIQYIIQGYLKHHKLPFDIFEKNLKKVEVNGKYIHTCEVEVPEIKLKKVKTVPTLSELEQIKEKVKTIENLEHRLLFNLLTNYPVLRNDLALVRIRNAKEKEPRVNFKKNTIVFPEVNKAKKKIVIELNEEDSEILNSMTFNRDQKYLLSINGDENNRCNNYTKLIKRLTKQYFDKSITHTAFRHLSVTKSFHDASHLPVKLQNEKIERDSALRGHSSRVAREIYLENTDIVNVSLDNKRVLNLMRGDEIVRVVNLKDIETILNFMDLLKK